MRISKDRDNETSTTTQEAQAREYADRHGWQVVAVEVDEGRSAYKANVKRPGFDRALKLIDSGVADVLIVWRLDRFARSIVGFWEDWRRIDAAGGELVSVTEDLDTTRTIGKMLVGLIAGFAEMESEAKSERITVWHDHRRANGAVPTGPRPFGYRRIKATRNTEGRLEVDPDEADEIRRLADAVLDGASLRSLVADLNRRNVPTSTGKRWSVRGLRHVLTNATVAGLRDDDNDVIEGCWEAILDRDAWERLREILLDPSRRTSDTNRPRWMLTSVATCGHCGGSMRAKPHTAGVRYTCRDCTLSIPAEATDDLVATALLDLIDRDAWARVQASSRTNGVDVEAFEIQRRDLIEQYAAGAIDADDFIRLDREIEQAVAAQAEPVDLPDVDDLATAWPELTVEGRQIVLGAITESITVAPAVRGRARFDPERLSITWKV